MFFKSRLFLVSLIGLIIIRYDNKSVFASFKLSFMSCTNDKQNPERQSTDVSVNKIFAYVYSLSFVNI
jgi:hypothetical protein